MAGIACCFLIGVMAERLTHFDDAGAARMVDVGAKPETERTARASARVCMSPEAADLVRAGSAAKGDVLGVARLAGVMAAKKTGEIIPLCHPLPLTSVAVEFAWPAEAILHIEAAVKTVGRTGVEMEAMTAVTAAALTVYDMLKSADRAIAITDVVLEEKTGGKSGHFRREA